MSLSEDASLPPAVWQRWLRPRKINAVEPVEGGFSGARLYRCTAAAADQTWALRCWPDDASLERIRQIHQVVEYARLQGCDLLPVQHRCTAGQTVTAIEGHCWELAQWLPGRPYADGGLPPEAAVAAAAAAVARFHSAVAGAGGRHAPAPAIRSRLERVGQLDRWLRQPADFLGPAAPGWLYDAALVAADAWRSRLPALKQRLAAAAPRPRSLQYVFRDIHSDHVLFDGPHVTALIDFDALRIDTPATDLARLVSSFAALVEPRVSIDHLWQAADGGYCRHRSLPGEDLELARLLAAVTPLISLANWVFWLGVEHRQFTAGEQRVAARVEQLTRFVRSMVHRQ